jgi:hypothetical protein
MPAVNENGDVADPVGGYDVDGKSWRFLNCVRGGQVGKGTTSNT